MDSPTSVVDDKLVAIAVNKGKISQAAVKWTIENLLVGGGSVLLLHVRAKSQAFDPKLTNPHIVRACSGIDVLDNLQEGYKEALDQHSRENLYSFLEYCRKKKVQSEMVILEDNDKAKAISDYVLAKHINLLVVGSGSASVSHKGVLKKLSGPDMAVRISRKAPYFCTVYIVAKGILQSVRAASSTAHDSSGNDVHYLEYPKSSHEPHIGQFSFSGSSVSSRVALLRPDEASDFEFKSPTPNHGHSDFTTGGTATFESDILFISNDKGTYRSSSPSRSSTCSDWSLDSYEPTYVALSSGNSVASPPPESMGNSIDNKLQKLELEMLNSMVIYESARNETPVVDLPTNINEDSSHPEEHQGSKVTCRTARPIAKFESKRL